ncbi:MAG: CPBP family intramembrane metalloprotease [Candidatus Binatus sp.]|uniref:CPBP family intramembrane glutamic endopeptidase n=1 Tax=Candidatus Binatus sp. TaxID=2811406 RepID=UPI0027230C3A|nr:CPBP family intramembrane glutamic endopeptidase [Candidatus Binatus sp.]MDO8431113.1 CPBP family intramembrane metalloprotease [Candidatus Binatus sp.]
MSFTARFALAVAAGLLAAIVAAPIVATAIHSAGWNFPFPRIFDRVVMATLLIAILWTVRDLKFVPLLRAGFSAPASNWSNAMRGLAVSLCAIAILFALAAIVSGRGLRAFGPVVPRLPKYFLSAIVIATIEETFFRGFLLAGMKSDFGVRGALLVSSAIYALAHLVRSPARFFVTGYEPMAGLVTLGHSLDQFANPAVAIPALVGLFLLGIVLGKAFLLTGTVYFSIGLHAGFVLGAKLWPKIVLGRFAMPWWIAGGGAVPLIGGAAAWLMAAAILLLLKPLSGVRTPPSVYAAAEEVSPRSGGREMPLKPGNEGKDPTRSRPFAK